MVEPHFIFNNKSSLELDIVIKDEWLPPVELAEDHLEHIEIPGRDGFLTIRKNRKKPIYKAIRGVLNNDNNKEIVKRWLSGEGELILSNEPEVFYKARVYGPVKFFYNFVTTNEFEISFICQPYGYLHSGKKVIEVTEKPTNIYNPGTEIAKPLITVYGDGPADLIIDNTMIRLNINQFIVIDSELLESYKDIDLEPFEGEFPTLKPGNNTIDWDQNITKVEIIPRWAK